MVGPLLSSLSRARSKHDLGWFKNTAEEQTPVPQTPEQQKRNTVIIRTLQLEVPKYEGWPRESKKNSKQIQALLSPDSCMPPPSPEIDTIGKKIMYGLLPKNGKRSKAFNDTFGDRHPTMVTSSPVLRAIEQEEADEMGWGVYNSPTDTTRYCDMDRQAYRDCNTQMNNAIHQIMMEKYREQEEDLHRDQLCVVQYLTPVLRTEFSNIHMFYLNNPNMNYSHSLFYENMKFVYLWTVPQKLDVSEINQ